MEKDEFKGFMAKMDTLVTALGLQQVAVVAGDAAVPAVPAVFDAPCTELVTAYGAEPGYETAVATFAGRVDADPPEGYLGSVVAESVYDVAPTPEGEKGKMVTLAIGWTSREAHVAAKAKPGGECPSCLRSSSCGGASHRRLAEAS